MTFANEPAILERLGKLPEADVLRYFQLLLRRGADRLEVLQHLGRVKLATAADYDHERACHELQVADRLITHESGGCFACQSERRLYFHHVIEVQHGGSASRANVVSLCFRCHKRLHPWLADELPDPKAKEWTSLKQFVDQSWIAKRAKRHA